MPGIEITCPYCFSKFADDAVHFRMETVFSEEDLDPKGEGRDRQEVATDRRFKSEEVKAQLAEYDLREKFVPHNDEPYEEFWKTYNGTTEKTSVSLDGKTAKVMPYHRPVFSPKYPDHRQYFGKPNSDRDVINENGMTYAAYDCFGKQTQRRVCPHCHNPLPGAYGKHPVMFISIIGITRAGKTVYLSQLCKYISRQLADFNISVTPTSIYAREYLEDNPVVMGKELPKGTPKEQLLQPLCFDLSYTKNGINENRTVVFYDIAGENCDDIALEKIHSFGPFIEHSDGIILLIDPEQFKTSSEAGEPTKVLDTIHALFANKSSEAVRKLPLAICVSKGDKVANEMIGSPLYDVERIMDRNGEYVTKFNAQSYNVIHDGMKRFVQNIANPLSVTLNTKYDNFNYFIMSAIGTDTKKLEGTNLDTPAGPVVPKRIIEPLVWMLHKFDFIGCEGELHEPKDWICDCDGTKHRIRVNQYCPVCKLNKERTWKCPGCKTEGQTGEWCNQKGCKYNRFGKKRTIWDSFKKK